MTVLKVVVKHPQSPSWRLEEKCLQMKSSAVVEKSQGSFIKYVDNHLTIFRPTPLLSTPRPPLTLLPVPSSTSIQPLRSMYILKMHIVDLSASSGVTYLMFYNQQYLNTQQKKRLTTESNISEWNIFMVQSEQFKLLTKRHSKNATGVRNARMHQACNSRQIRSSCNISFCLSQGANLRKLSCNVVSFSYRISWKVDLTTFVLTVAFSTSVIHTGSTIYFVIKINARLGLTSTVLLCHTVPSFSPRQYNCNCRLELDETQSGLAPILYLGQVMSRSKIEVRAKVRLFQVRGSLERLRARD